MDRALHSVRIVDLISKLDFEKNETTKDGSSVLVRILIIFMSPMNRIYGGKLS